MEWIKWIFAVTGQRFARRINESDRVAVPKMKPETTNIHKAIANFSISHLTFLLETEPDIEIQDQFGLTPLHLAIKRNFISGIHLLLEKGASVNIKDSEGNTPLHFAVLTRNLNFVQILLNKGAEVNERDEFGLTCLQMAALNNDWDIFDNLLHSKTPICDVDVEALKLILSKKLKTSEETDLNTLVHMRNDSDDHIAPCICTLLHIAVRKSQCNLIRMLLNFGADPNSRDNNRQTPLHIAIENDSIEIVKLLIDGGADVNIIGENEEPLLFSAIKKRNIKIMSELLSSGANMEFRHPDGNKTPLIFCAEENFEPEVELLLERGSEVNVSDDDLYTPLDYVTIEKNFNLFQKLLEKGAQMETTIHPDNNCICVMFDDDVEQTITLILKNKLNINMTGDYEKTSLHYASNNGDLVDLLLNNGADIEAIDDFGATPLLNAMKSYAFDKKDTSGIEVLIKRGANVNAKDGEGKTLLHYASGNRYFIDILLAKGADVEAKDLKGKTPIFDAIHFKDDAASAMENILTLGANVNVQDKHGKTPLHYAVCLENPSLANILLSYGADLELKDSNGLTPFFEAVLMHSGEFEDNNSIITILIEKGAFVNSTNNCGKTVLFYELNIDLLEKITSSGGDVTIRDNNGQTALHWAMLKYDSNNDTDLIIERLIEKGGDLLSEDNRGITPLQMFLGLKYLWPGHMSDIKPLLVAENDEGNTLLHIAVREGWFNCMKHLLDIGVNIDSKNNYDETPIHVAAGKVDEVDGVKMVKELLNRGAATNVQDYNKETPLHKAARAEFHDIIKDLLVRGARMDVENSDGNTPLDFYSLRLSEPQDNKMIEHIVKLKAANLFDDITCNVDSVDCSVFESLKEECLKELKRLEDYKFDYLSLIDVFRKLEDPMFVTSCRLKEIIASPSLELQFPIYDLYLKVKFEKAELRNSLLDNATVIFANLIPQNKLPNEILRKILCKLSNDELSCLVNQ